MSDTITIRTTGTCFDDACDIVTNPDIIPYNEHKEAFIIHGLVSRKENKKSKYAHAWVLFKGRRMELCIDEENETCCVCYSEKEFNAIYTVYHQTAYKLIDIIIEGLKSPLKSTGPFKRKYLKHCSDWDDVKHIFDKRKNA